MIWAAAALLAGCSGGELAGSAARAYGVYDARVEREIVAGHDDARGNYVEVRLSPRSRSASAGNTGGTRLRADAAPARQADGKAVRR